MKVQTKVLLITKNDFRHERDGGSQRVSAVVRALEASGCIVEYIAVKPFSTSRGINAPRLTFMAIWAAVKVLFKALGTRSVSVAKWYNPRSAAAVQRATRSWMPDVTLIEYSQLAPYAAVTSAPRLIDLHNIESTLLANYATSARSPLRARAASYEAAAMTRVEAKLPAGMDAIAFVSTVDRLFLESPHHKAVFVDAPNGVRAECFTSAEEQSDTVVFVGHLGWRPNIDAARWLVEAVWPIVRVLSPDARLQLVGRSPAAAVRELASEDIEIIGDVISTIPYVAAARVATAPLLAAGGTRLKILEALASGTPVVATTLGALGIEDVDPLALTIEDEPLKFAEAIAARWKTSGQCDTRAQVEHYRWERTLQELCRIVLSLGERDRMDGAKE